jgi:acetyl-CoA carboxylase alpha subunit
MVAMEAVKRQILAALDELSAQPVEALVRARREKYRRAGALPGRFPVLA